MVIGVHPHFVLMNSSHPANATHVRMSLGRWEAGPSQCIVRRHVGTSAASRPR
jgi:hypothetical protein